MKAFLGACVLLVACGGAPPPRSVLDAEAMKGSPAVRAARRDAPEAVLEAERVLERARAAHRDGREEDAERLGAEAGARFDLAITLARAAEAERRIAEAESRIRAATQERERHETARRAEERRIAVLEAEAEARRVLEAERARAAEDEDRRAKRLPAAEQRLRDEATRAAAEEARVRARMICLAGRTLAEDRDAFDAAVAEAKEAADRARRGREATPDLLAALAYRDACVRALESVRGTPRAVEERAGIEDAVFLAASQGGGLDPRRDERGVVLTLRRFFGAGNRITAPARALLEKVAGIVRDRPVRIVVEAHGAADRVTGVRADAVAAALTALGVDRSRIGAEGFGTTRPLMPTGERGRPDPRDERIEVVVLATGALAE